MISPIMECSPSPFPKSRLHCSPKRASSSSGSRHAIRIAWLKSRQNTIKLGQYLRINSAVLDIVAAPSAENTRTRRHKRKSMPSSQSPPAGVQNSPMAA